MSKTLVWTRPMEGRRAWLTVLLTSHSDDTQAASLAVKLWTEPLHCASHPPLYSGSVPHQPFVHASLTSIVISPAFIALIIYGAHATLRITDRSTVHAKRTLVMSIACSSQAKQGINILNSIFCLGSGALRKDTDFSGLREFNLRQKYSTVR